MSNSNYIEMNIISKEEALQLSETLKNEGGIPSNGRVLLAVPTEKFNKTSSGIILSPLLSENNEGVAKKARVVQLGPLPKEAGLDYPTLEVGSIISYGIYGGKEVFPFLPNHDHSDKYKFYVLALTEIIYIQ